MCHINPTITKEICVTLHTSAQKISFVSYTSNSMRASQSGLQWVSYWLSRVHTDSEVRNNTHALELYDCFSLYWKWFCRLNLIKYKMTRAIHGNMWACIHTNECIALGDERKKNVLMERKSLFFSSLASLSQQRKISTLHIWQYMCCICTLYLVIIWGFTDESDKWWMITSEKQFTCKPKGKRILWFVALGVMAFE